MTLHNYRARTLGVIPIRVGLGVVWVVAARLLGLATAPALLAFAVGLLAITFAALNDPRARFLAQAAEPVAAPLDAVVAPRWQQALAATVLGIVAASACCQRGATTASSGAATGSAS